jgi:hypothetical protein
MNFFLIATNTFTEHHGQVVNTAALYLGDNWVQVLAQKLAILTEVFRAFSQSLQANAGWYLKTLGHNRFLPHCLQFVILQSSFYPTLYNLSY